MAKSSKQQRLPGVNEKLQDLHDAAIKYAEARDERQQMLAHEVDLKADLLLLMKKHKKTEYTYEDVHIEIVHEKEKVKVKINKESSDEDESDE